MSVRLLPLVLAVVTGCGLASPPSPDGGWSLCAQETRAEQYQQGMAKTGPQGYQVQLVSAQPEPPARFSNTWTVAISTPAKAPAEGALLTVTPDMPDHGHGTSTKVVVVEQGAGRYQLQSIDLWMPGYWEVTIQVKHGSAVDQVGYAFCVEE